MAWKRVVVEMGMGTDIRGGDYTKAAVRALRDALWHNSLSVARALGMDADDMRVEVIIGVPRPEAVDTAQVLAILPHGTGTGSGTDPSPTIWRWASMNAPWHLSAGPLSVSGTRRSVYTAGAGR